jgi:hypothetical protein
MASAKSGLSSPPSTFILSQFASLAGTVGFLGLIGAPQLLWLVCPALFATSYIWSKRQPSGVSRAQAKSLSTASGLAFAGLAAAGFTLGVLAFPEAFTFPLKALPLLAALIGAGVGLGSLVLSLCALDTTGLS